MVAARADKERKYSELLASRRCKLVVVAFSTGGRWSSEALKFVQALAFAKARAAPEYLRKSVMLSWQRRWTRMLAIASANAFANGLLRPAKAAGTGALDALDGPTPELCELWAGRDTFGDGGVCESGICQGGGAGNSEAAVANAGNLAAVVEHEHAAGTS